VKIAVPETVFGFSLWHHPANGNGAAQWEKVGSAELRQWPKQSE